MIGETFDQASFYSHEPAEVKKLLNYYFDQGEIKNKVVLDAGCRVGDYVGSILQMGAKKVIGVDLSRASIKTAKHRYRHNDQAVFYCGDIARLKMLRGSSIDTVICFGTIGYLKPAEVKKALAEFIRVTKSGGAILVLFQKNKGLIIRLAQRLADALPLNFYLCVIEQFGFLLQPLVSRLVGRPIKLDYLKYDVLLGMRGLHFGIPVKIAKKFRVKTVTGAYCSEQTTASYKIKVIK